MATGEFQPEVFTQKYLESGAGLVKQSCRKIFMGKPPLPQHTFSWGPITDDEVGGALLILPSVGQPGSLS